MAGWAGTDVTPGQESRSLQPAPGNSAIAKITQLPGNYTAGYTAAETLFGQG